MQRQVTVCDLCGATDLKPGYVVLTISGDRSQVVKGHVPGNRNVIELCDDCAASLAEWIVSRGVPKPVEVPPPVVAPAVVPVAPTHVDEHRDA